MNHTDLAFTNRIALLKSRNRDNGRIVTKLERKRRKIRGENNDRT